MKPIIANNPQELAEALGLTASDSEEWAVQHALLKRLRKIVAQEGLTHAEVARHSRSSRTRVTAILNGNLTRVSTDLLIRLLSALGYRVKVTVNRTDAA